MINGYITRGTTIHGKPVNEGETHEMDLETFRALKSVGFCIEAPTEQKTVDVAEVAPDPAPVKPKTKGKVNL